MSETPEAVKFSWRTGVLKRPSREVRQQVYTQNTKYMIFNFEGTLSLVISAPDALVAH